MGEAKQVSSCGANLNHIQALLQHVIAFNQYFPQFQIFTQEKNLT
jgi:hypothetical protein